VRIYETFSSMQSYHLWVDDRGGLRDCHFAIYRRRDFSILSERVLVAGVGSHCSFVFKPEACAPVESCKGHFMYCERRPFLATSSQAVSKGFIQALKQAGARPGLVQRLEEESRNLPSPWSRIFRWLKERVSVDESVLAGEPTFAGSRLPLRSVGEMIHRHGQSAVEELAEDYPYLTSEDMKNAECLTRSMHAWRSDCLEWRGRVLTGEHGHWCNEWDLLPVDETCDEWPCSCDVGKEFKRKSKIHSAHERVIEKHAETFRRLAEQEPHVWLKPASSLRGTRANLYLWKVSKAIARARATSPVDNDFIVCATERLKELKERVKRHHEESAAELLGVNETSAPEAEAEAEVEEVASSPPPSQQISFELNLTDSIAVETASKLYGLTPAGLVRALLVREAHRVARGEPLNQEIAAYVENERSISKLADARASELRKP
jgi:uncharacterized protein (DUF433 family)